MIDPGTGAYLADRDLRNHLASWEAHNGPHPLRSGYPKRLGPFLWGERHATPSVRALEAQTVIGSLDLPSGRIERRITRWGNEEGWQVDDNFEPAHSAAPVPFGVCWHFAPGSELLQTAERTFRVSRSGHSLEIGLDAAWAKVEMVSPKAALAATGTARDLRGVCSPAFRVTDFGPQLVLTARGHNPSLFRTTFLGVNQGQAGG